MYPALPVTYKRSIVGLMAILILGGLLTSVVFVGAVWLQGQPGVFPSVPMMLGVIGLVSLLATLVTAYVYEQATLTFSEQGIEIKQLKSLFYTSTSSCEWRDIEDVTVTKAGLLQLPFNVGNLTVQTAGTEVKVTLTWLPKPDDLQSMIDHYQGLYG